MHSLWEANCGIVTIVLGDLCDNIGLVGVSAKWSYVTASPSHHDQAIPILSPLLFMHVGHPYIPLFKIQGDLLVINRILPLLPSCGKSGKRIINRISATFAIMWQKWQKDELWDFCHFCHHVAKMAKNDN